MKVIQLLHSVAMTTEFLLIIVSLRLVATEIYMEDCSTAEEKDSNYKFCVEPSGFYYSFDDVGTWDISLTEGEGLHERQVFLESLQNNNCPLTVSTNSENCANDCCYCELEFPLPRHPITNSLVVPNGLTCKASLREQKQLPVQQSQCKSNREDPSLIARLPFLCLYLDNLMQLENTYNNPRNLSIDGYNRHKDKLQQGWRNSSVVIFRNATSSLGKESNGMDVMPSENATETPSSTPTPEPETTTTIMLEEVNEIKFSLITDDEALMDYVTVESIPDSNLTLSFSAPTECLSKNRKWYVYPPCWYSIKSATLFTCSDVRLAINVTSILIHRYISNVNVSMRMEVEQFWDENLEEFNNNSSLPSSSSSYYSGMEYPLECDGIPENLQVIEVWAEGEHVSTLLSLEKLLLMTIGTEVVITASISQKVISEKDFTSLSRFWAGFHFGDCLYRTCWRDLWNVLPNEYVQSLHALHHHDDQGKQKLSPKSEYYRWGYFLPVLLLCLILIVRSCTIAYYDSEFF